MSRKERACERSTSLTLNHKENSGNAKKSLSCLHEFFFEIVTPFRSACEEGKKSLQWEIRHEELRKLSKADAVLFFRRSGLSYAVEIDSGEIMHHLFARHLFADHQALVAMRREQAKENAEHHARRNLFIKFAPLLAL